MDNRSIVGFARGDDQRPITRKEFDKLCAEIIERVDREMRSVPMEYVQAKLTPPPERVH